jgi:hypothetical protein
MVKPDALGSQPCGYGRAKGVNYASRFTKSVSAFKRRFQIGLLRTVNRLAQKPLLFLVKLDELHDCNERIRAHTVKSQTKTAKKSPIALRSCPMLTSETQRRPVAQEEQRAIASPALNRTPALTRPPAFV